MTTTETNKVDCKSITTALASSIYRQPNRVVSRNVFLPGNPFECDVLALLPSCYFYEYEIKMSRSDYTRDFHKRTWLSAPTKHDMYSGKAEVSHTRSRRPMPIPKKFYFVTPAGIVDSVPEHCGLIEYSDDFGPMRLRVIQEAPNLKRATKLGVEHLFNLLQKQTRVLTAD